MRRSLSRGLAASLPAARGAIVAAVTVWAVASAGAAVQEANVVGDAGTAVLRGGVRSLDRRQFFNVHSAPVPSDWDAPESALFAQTYGAHLGRSFSVSGRMGTLPPDHGQGLNLDKLKSDCAQPVPNPGWPAASVEMITSCKTEQYYPSMSPKGYVPRDHAAAAAMWSAFVRYCAPDQPMQICEVANEPNVKVAEANTTWAEMIALHVAIAERLHADFGRNGSLVVGGPTEAFPEYEAGGFRHFNTTLRPFVDAAGPSLDFLSVHLYDTYGASMDTDAANFSMRTGSNVDAVLDLAEAYSEAALDGRRLPHLVSEYGSGFKLKSFEYKPVHDWFVLRGVTGKLMQFLRRPDRIVKAVPFIVGKATWHTQNPPYPYQLWHRAANGSWTPTHLAKFYAFWAGIEGVFLKVRTDDANVQVVALADASACQTHLVVNNLRDAPVNVSVPPEFALSDVTVRRLRLDPASEAPALDALRVPASDAQRLSLSPQEAVLLTSSRAPGTCAPGATEVETIMFAHQTVVAITAAPQLFRVDVGAASAASAAGAGAPVRVASVRVGFSVPSLAALQAPELTVGGAVVEVSLERHMAGRPPVSANTGEVLCGFEVPLDTQQVSVPPSGQVEVALRFPPAARGGFVSTVALFVVTGSP